MLFYDPDSVTTIKYKVYKEVILVPSQLIGGVAKRVATGIGTDSKVLLSSVKTGAKLRVINCSPDPCEN